MAQRPKGCQSIVMTADGYIHGDGVNPRNVYALIITATGATAGDKIVLRNGTETGTIKAQFELPATAGLWCMDFGRYGIEFFVNCYVDFTIAGAAGTVTATVIYG